jgi:hypothetical protein
VNKDSPPPVGYMELLVGSILLGEERRCAEMSEQPRKKMSEMPGKSSSEQQRQIKSKAIPQWAQGLYYNEGVFSEVLVYHDDESIYIEHKGREDGVVRYTFEMIEGLKIVEEEEESTNSHQ